MTEDPRKRRKEIEENLADLRAQLRAGEVPQRKRESEELEKNLKFAHIDHARHIIDTAELGVVIGEAADARQALADATERQDILQGAVTAEERDLKKHLVENFDVFAGDCMKIAAKVEENRDKVNTIIATMREQRATLAAKWAPLVEAVKLQTNVPRIEIELLPTIPLRPPGVGADGKIIRGTDDWGRPLGDVGLNRSERTAEGLAQAKREAAEQAAKRAGVAVPEGADAEAVIDAARAMTPEQLAEQKKQHEAEQAANLAASTN
jgi:hypothetical protein